MSQYEQSKPNISQYLFDAWESTRINLNLLRNLEAGTTFPSDPVEGQFALRTDIENGTLFQRTETDWIKLWSVQKGLDASQIPLDVESIEGDTVEQAFEWIEPLNDYLVDEGDDFE